MAPLVIAVGEIGYSKKMQRFALIVDAQEPLRALLKELSRKGLSVTVVLGDGLWESMVRAVLTATAGEKHWVVGVTLSMVLNVIADTATGL
jgi:hypothetical protein